MRVFGGDSPLVDEFGAMLWWGAQGPGGNLIQLCSAVVNTI